MTNERMIPTFTEERNPAWKELREKVGAFDYARIKLEEAEQDTRERMKLLEHNEVVRDQQISALLSHSETQAQTIKALVTQHEFSPFKMLVFGLCILAAVTLLVLMVRR